MKRSKRCPHPNCPVPERPDPRELSQCTLNKPIWIVIPPGGHIHLDCPVHPEGHIVYGPDITWCERYPSPTRRWDTPKWWCETNLPDPNHQIVDYEHDPGKDLMFDSTKPFGTATGSGIRNDVRFI